MKIYIHQVFSKIGPIRQKEIFKKLFHILLPHPIYIYVCVCVCIYIYVCVCVCVCVCVWRTPSRVNMYVPNGKLISQVFPLEKYKGQLKTHWYQKIISLQ